MPPLRRPDFLGDGRGRGAGECRVWGGWGRARGLGTLAMMHFGRREYGPALELLERSAEAAPNPRTYAEMGMTLTMMGRPQEALERYRHAATLDTNLVSGWRGVAAAA